MGKKRMFSKVIVQNDVFLDMPLSTQALYFHLSMNADDYGFVTPKRIMRMIGANDDDLKVLLLKRYILSFDSGVVVIKHWHVNNTVRKDRSQETSYKPELDTLTYNEFGAYTELKNIAKNVELLEQNIAHDEQLENRPIKNNNGGVSVPTTPPFKNLQQSDTKKQGSPSNGKPNDNQTETQIRLDKIRLDKISNTTNVVLEPKKAPKMSSKEIDFMFEKWEEIIGYKISSRIKQNRFACSNLLKKHSIDELTRALQGVAMSHSDRYAPRISDYASLQSKWNDLMVWGRQEMSQKQRIASI